MRSLLIANRGEIACRIMRTASLLGIRTIAVYSEVDANSMHVRLADEGYCIGPAAALQSYLNIPALIEAIKASGADAVHPGYGFLSENEAFAAAVVEAGAVWVGPDAASRRIMGSKIEAKRTVSAAGTPVVPGYNGDDQSEKVLIEQAERVGFPLLIKASAGGGGKGMRVVRSASAFTEALAGARREAKNAFNDDRVLLERYLTAPKHIEVQILADQHGNTLHLFERDCSVQRRHQKVIEEAPAPSVDAQLRERLGAAAVAAARSVNYVGAGTIEFITENGEFFFMEMNTRLQVEHPVTEAITGLDLVEWQLRIAAGEKLPFSQADLRITGHAVEARVYAENPSRRFLPSTGRLLRVSFPADVRVDSGVRSGDSVSIHYDPMIAKVIAHGSSRAEAIGRLRRALASSEICGVQHNTGYLVSALAEPDFVGGHYTTGFADAHHESLIAVDEQPFLMAAAIATNHRTESRGPWDATDGFAPNLGQGVECDLLIGETRASVRLPGKGERNQIVPGVVQVDTNTVRMEFKHQARSVKATVLRDGKVMHVIIDGTTLIVRDLATDIDRFVLTGVRTGGIVAPLPGQVLQLKVKAGDQVREGDLLAIIEAMKMEHSIRSPRDGKVSAVHCTEGGRVDEGAELITLDPEE